MQINIIQGIPTGMTKILFDRFDEIALKIIGLEEVPCPYLLKTIGEPHWK
ncbi:MAG: hypothetical protein WCQ96_01020 [Patescibacteria group bacterium]